MLSITGLNHVYANGTRALDDVTLEIGSGMFGLLGPNGAGKSTLMRCLATLQEPTSGSIRFGGLDVLAQPGELRKQLGYLPQDFGVYPRVSCWDMLEHLAILKGLVARAERRNALEAVLVQVNLWPMRNQTLSGFSGGMRQRFGIAQALLGNPRLVIVDEPTAGLDPEERNRFNDLLSEIGESVVVILSTHIVEDVADVCTRMAIMLEGKVVACDTPAALTGALRGKIWSQVVDKAELPELRERFDVVATRLRAGRSVVRVLADVAPGGAFEAAAATIEDVYFSTLYARRAAE